RKAEESGAPAVGMDIDAAAFITMRMKNQQVEPKSPAELKKIISSTHLPFIIKGIFSVEDALRAVEAGAAAIYVSNHGGRVMDYMPGALDVLPKIREKVGKEVKIIVDGGFREGIDIYKGLALGADFVAIGRPAAIAVIGGGAQGLELQTREWKLELSQAMLLTGCEKVTDISPKSLYLA
ncbi:MAG TPA: alpha-hydroxy-acid oxidizing enzyme, partial [Spirochaetia bacterium]|nr:alpha-hydroxy-acid oxidizing enzyme [Spirochaetia bacterium]